MTERQIEWLFGIHFTVNFVNWMRGQTVGVSEYTGDALYYKHDIKRYINALIDNDGIEPEVID